MTLRTMALGVTMSLVALVACGGGAKQADSPGTCPEGTVLKGSDCLPTDDSSGAAGGGKGDDESPVTAMTTHASSDTSSSTPAAGGTPYDKDAVNIELKRAARQVKANCGTATDDSGNATGPWGTTKASVTLGRNGHVKQVTVPSPYDGKPVGICVVHAFEKIQFPPYAASSDTTVDVDIEIRKK